MDYVKARETLEQTRAVVAFGASRKPECAKGRMGEGHLCDWRECCLNAIISLLFWCG
jgi:hypothetical protein